VVRDSTKAKAALSWSAFCPRLEAVATSDFDSGSAEAAIAPGLEASAIDKVAIRKTLDTKSCSFTSWRPHREYRTKPGMKLSSRPRNRTQHVSGGAVAHRSLLEM
jgi:hypothetical protein